MRGSHRPHLDDDAVQRVEPAEPLARDVIDLRVGLLELDVVARDHHVQSLRAHPSARIVRRRPPDDAFLFIHSVARRAGTKPVVALVVVAVADTSTHIADRSLVSRGGATSVGVRRAARRGWREGTGRREAPGGTAPPPPRLETGLSDDGVRDLLEPAARRR